MRGFLVVSVLALGVAGGCGSSPVSVPQLDPKGAAEQALRDYDTNGDGQLDASEIERSPGLKAALNSLDKNQDGRISEDEIASRVTEYWKDQVALMPFSCQVLLDGQPLANAVVKLVPEAFLGPNIRAAVGTTDSNGLAGLSIPGLSAPGVHCGIYRVEIDTVGVSSVPSKYNVQTTLGQEVATDIPTAERGLVFTLTTN